MNKRFYWLIVLFAFSAPSFAEDCVVLLHGLGRTETSMSRIESELNAAGYRVWNQGYASTESDIMTLTREAVEPGVAFCADADNTHFVTHSLGGILVRTYLQDKAFDGRVVMIGPPNHGSEIPDKLGEIKLFKLILGPAGLQLGTGESSFLRTLKPIQGEIGVIVGNRTSDPWFSWMIPGPDDGKVSVESAKLNEMKEFLVVPHGHTFIMHDKRVIDQVLFFLETGNFISESPTATTPSAEPEK